MELRRGDDGYWKAVAVHEQREQSFDGTVLLRGEVERSFGRAGAATIRVRYGIEQIFVPEGSAGALPAGRSHTVAVQLKVDLFGRAVPQHFVVDGAPFDLHRR